MNAKQQSAIAGFRLNSIFGIVTCAAIAVRFGVTDRWGWAIGTAVTAVFMTAMHAGANHALWQNSMKETVNLTVPTDWTGEQK